MTLEEDHQGTGKLIKRLVIAPDTLEEMEACRARMEARGFSPMWMHMSPPPPRAPDEGE